MYKGYVLINCDLGAEEYVAEELRQIDGIRSASLTFGVYDAIVEIDAENQGTFEKIVAEIRKQSRVVSTMTLTLNTG